MTSRAPGIIQAVKSSMAALTPSTYANPTTSVGGTGPNNATAFTAVGTAQLLEETGHDREFAVTLDPGGAAADLSIGGLTGNGSYYIVVTVHVVHENSGMTETDFFCVVADDHRIVLDGVPRLMRTTQKPAGFGECTLVGPVSLVSDPSAGTTMSTFRFRVDYEDTIQ